jgi:hypothetical protein
MIVEYCIKYYITKIRRGRLAGLSADLGLSISLIWV